jgi:hypothetical protein
MVLFMGRKRASFPFSLCGDMTLGLGLQLFNYTLSFRNHCENVFADLNREERMSWEIAVRCFNPLETSRRKFRWNGC